MINLQEIVLKDFCGENRISSFIPRHSDMTRIAEYARLVRRPRVLDAGCGTGFLTMLLALEGLNMTGVNREISLDNQSKYSGVKNIKFQEGIMEDAKTYSKQNVIFNSWMPAFQDWSSYFHNRKDRPELIIYVKAPTCTGVQPGMNGNPNNVDTYKPYPDYLEADSWSCFGHNDFIAPPSLELRNPPIGSVIVHAKIDFYKANQKEFLAVKEKQISVKPYNWEAEMPKS